ncbi:MAG: PAS domain S-box protein [Candidatus Heimdallarchaeaceae archaeon]
MKNQPTISSFEEVFDTIPYSILIIEDFWKIAYSNKIFREITGYTEEDLKTMTTLDFIHPDDKHIVVERAEIITKGEKPAKELQIRLISKDGSIYLAIVKVSDVVYNGKKCRIFVGSDISSEPLIEQSPELISSVITSLTKHSELGLWVDDLNDNTVYINDFLCYLLGYTFEEIRKKSVTDFLHPLSQDTYFHILKERKQGKTTSSYELILVDEKRRPRTFRVIGSMLFDKLGKPMGSVGFFTNIEPIKKLSQIVSTLNKYALYSKYKDLSSFWRNVLEDIIQIFYADFGMVFIDREIVYQKGFFQKTFSPSEILEDLTRKEEVAFYLKEDCEKISEKAKSVLVSTVFFNQQPAGFILIGSKSEELFLPEDVDLFLAFCKQITLSYEHHFLFIQSEDEREFISVLLDILSHDFLNANTSVQGYLELLKFHLEEKNYSKLKEYIERSITSVERSEKILQTVQQLSKIHAEKRSHRILALRALIENALSSQKGENMEKQIKATIDCSKKLHVFAGDLLQDAFESIINNAIKHNTNEKIKIAISCKEFQKDEDNYIEIRIEDNGKGIQDELKNEFFSNIRRGDKRFQSGKGLNLYLTKVIIDSYNGDIEIQSKDSKDYTKGTVVIIKLLGAVR